MCWIFHKILPVWLPMRCPLEKIVYATWEVLKKYVWEPRNGDCGRLGNLFAIFLENNSSMTSQLSLNLGVFRTVYINTWRVFQKRVHKSLIGNLAGHSFSLFDRNNTQPQTKQDEWTTASLSLAERWAITEIRRQLNSVLTYSLLTDVLPL